MVVVIVALISLVAVVALIVVVALVAPFALMQYNSTATGLHVLELNLKSINQNQTFHLYPEYRIVVDESENHKERQQIQNSTLESLRTALQKQAPDVQVQIKY